MINDYNYDILAIKKHGFEVVIIKATAAVLTFTLTLIIISNKFFFKIMTPGSVETIWLKIYIGCKTLSLGVIYRLPRGNTDNAIDIF